MRYWKSVAAGALICVSLLAGGAVRAQDCSAREQRISFPRATVAIDRWESMREIAVAPAVKTKVLSDFCTAGKRLSQDKAISHASIDGASDGIVFKYLDRATDPARSGQTVSAIMRAEFGAGGLSPAEVKRYGRLAITYTLDVDSLRVKGNTYGRIPRLLVEVGKARVEGLKYATVLCGGDVVIDSSIEATFKC